MDDQWKWAKDGNTLLTDRDNGRYTTAYWTWDDDDQEYELVSTEHLQAIDCRAQ